MTEPSSKSPAFDPVWEEAIYGSGKQLNRYPYDNVVSFVFRNRPRDLPPSEIHILEVGCGAGNNLWFAAREGFQVAGIDASGSAIEFARTRFDEDGLSGDLRVGDFSSLPFSGGGFHLVIDRGAITCAPAATAKRAVREIWRVLRPQGRFLFNPYSDRHTSASSGQRREGGVTDSIRAGTLVGVGQICFYSRADVVDTLGAGWRILSLRHFEETDTAEGQSDTHAEWRAVVEKLE